MPINVDTQKRKDIKHPGIYFSLRWKILLGFTLIFSVVFALAFYWFYQFATDTALRRIQDDLTSTLQGGAAGVNTDELLALSREGKPNADNFTDDPRFQTQLDWLDTIHKIEPRAWPYIYIPSDQAGEIIFVVDLFARHNPSRATGFMEHYQSKGFLIKGLDELTLRTVDGRFDTYTDKWGRWVSAYTPVKDKNGAIVAAIGIDFEADYVNQVRQSILDRVALAFLLTYTSLFLLVFLFSDALTGPILKLTQAIDALGDGNYSQNFSGLKSAGRFSDEIVKLAHVFAVMEKHNQNQAANLQAIFNSVAEGVLVLDLQGKLLAANPALLRMIPEEQLTKIISKPLGKTVQWKHKVFSVTSSPVPEIGSVAVFRDQTRHHETERARDALIATASHELRTPLAAIMNYLELLLMRVKLDKVDIGEFKDHLTRALENSKRLQRLVDNILDQAQVQAGVLELKNQPFDLRALLERTHQLLEVLIKEKNLSYQQTVELDVPEKIVGDAERLQQVLVNLIGNAIKFTNQGTIKVSVSIPRKNELYIQVADSGPGIPPEQLPDIFEAFRRGSNYAQRERQGAGLGLSIAKEIVTRMGGEIYVSSEPGVGSTFTFILPVEET